MKRPNNALQGTRRKRRAPELGRLGLRLANESANVCCPLGTLSIVRPSDPDRE
jgi:hypothetical protein